MKSIRYTQKLLYKLFLIPSIFLLACADNTEYAKTEIVLGKQLFFEPMLSRDSSISCASCHRPQFAFADTVAFSKGVLGRNTTRNSPSILNQADRNFYFWDGRAETLEEQALGPMESHLEMDFPVTLTVRRLLKNEAYKRAFMHIYGKAPSKDLVAKAIASYEKTLESGVTAFDNYMNGEDTLLMSESAKRGLAIFNGKGKCFDCHFGVDFTGSDRFKNIGLYNGNELNDQGRYNVTGKPKDIGAFKVPGLRNVALTAPYMHNGMFRTISQVIDYYNEPDKFVNNPINRDSSLKFPLGLSKQEKKDLENFLLSLTDLEITQPKGSEPE
jgi:cytochrome c peroxidase